MAAQAGTDKARVDNLTCARFFAALLVFLHHAANLFPMPVWMKHFFYNGYMGVTFFFVLSGFVISASSADEMFAPDTPTILRFYVRRIARIVPIWFFLSLPLLVSDALRQASPEALWRYLTFTQAWSGDRTVAFSFLSLSWTLSCEFFSTSCFPRSRSACCERPKSASVSYSRSRRSRCCSRGSARRGSMSILRAPRWTARIRPARIAGFTDHPRGGFANLLSVYASI